MKQKLNCIMLIDDDFATNLFHRIVIEEGGIAKRIIVKNNGEDALEYLNKPFSDTHPKPNIIFLDINMPRMNGWEFLEKYKHLSESNHADNIIVMLSTSANPDDLKRAEENPFIKEYKSKPLTLELLEEIMNKYFHQTVNL